MTKFDKCRIILSNNYYQTCKCFKKHKVSNSAVINIEEIKALIDQAFTNGYEIKEIPEFIFYGVNTLEIWNNEFTQLIEYIKAKPDFALISVQVETDFLTEEQLMFLKTNKIRLWVALDKYLNNIEKLKTYINLIIDIRPLTDFRINIEPKTITHLFDVYKLCDELGISYLHFYLDKFSEWTTESKTNLITFINSFLNYIKEKFQNDDIPLMPTLLKDTFMLVFLKNYEIKYDARAIDFIDFQCDSLIGKSITINYDGKTYLCSHCNFSDKTNILNISKLNDELLYYEQIYETSIAELNPLSNSFNCKNCDLNSVCNTGCYADNLYLTQFANIAPDIYCFFYKEFFKKTVEMIKALDDNKNETFKDYFYGCLYAAKLEDI